MLLNALKELRVSVKQYREAKRQTGIAIVESEKAIQKSNVELTKYKADHLKRMEALEEERKSIRTRHEAWRADFQKEQEESRAEMARLDRSLDFLKARL